MSSTSVSKDPFKISITQRKRLLSHYHYDNESKIISTMKRLGMKNRNEFYIYLLNPHYGYAEKEYRPIYNKPKLSVDFDIDIP